MRGEGRLLRIGEFLVGLACRRLPRRIRDGRYQEWAAELPVILHDPEIRLGGRPSHGRSDREILSLASRPGSSHYEQARILRMTASGPVRTAPAPTSSIRRCRTGRGS
jgi:hypothetical protein